VKIPGRAGADAAAKVSSMVAGMLAGADSIDDLSVLREGAVANVLPGVKAPSTLGTFLRGFTFGHVRQLGAVAASLLVKLAALAILLPAAAPGDRDAVTWLDVDDTTRRTYGYCKQGVGYGYNKVQGREVLADAIAATRRTGHSAAMICARLDWSVLQPQRRRRGPGRRRTVFHHRRRWTQRSPPRSARSPTRGGCPSNIRRRSSTKSSGRWISDRAGRAKPPTPRSPPNHGNTTSPPG